MRLAEIAIATAVRTHVGLVGVGRETGQGDAGATPSPHVAVDGSARVVAR